jgi:hypothetical protein
VTRSWRGPWNSRRPAVCTASSRWAEEPSGLDLGSAAWLSVLDGAPILRCVVRNPLGCFIDVEKPILGLIAVRGPGRRRHRQETCDQGTLDDRARSEESYCRLPREPCSTTGIDGQLVEEWERVQAHGMSFANRPYAPVRMTGRPPRAVDTPPCRLDRCLGQKPAPLSTSPVPFTLSGGSRAPSSHARIASFLRTERFCADDNLCRHECGAPQGANDADGRLRFTLTRLIACCLAPRAVALSQLHLGHRSFTR